MTAYARQRVSPHAPLFEGPHQQDFPAAAADRQGSGAWVAAVWHEPRGPELLPAWTERPRTFADYAPMGGGDQIRLLRLSLEGGIATPAAPLDVTERGRDVWRPAVAVAGNGSVLVTWTEKRDGNWDLFGRRFDPATRTFCA